VDGGFAARVLIYEREKNVVVDVWASDAATITGAPDPEPQSVDFWIDAIFRAIRQTNRPTYVTVTELKTHLQTYFLPPN